jgi:hypothetical protein
LLFDYRRGDFMSATAVVETSNADERLPADERSPGTAIDSGLRRRLEAALDLEADDPRRLRLSVANTSVTFDVLGGESVTVLLDRNPPIVTDGSEPAEVTISLDPELADRFSQGAISLPPKLLAGAARCHGPVRKYLMVDAVLRGLLAANAGCGR